MVWRKEIRVQVRSGLPLTRKAKEEEESMSPGAMWVPETKSEFWEGRGTAGAEALP